jgi:hypothetical protein
MQLKFAKHEKYDLLVNLEFSINPFNSSIIVAQSENMNS